MPAGGEVDQPLHDEHDLGPAGAAVRRGRRRVRDDGAAVHRHGRHVVDGGRDRHALVERVERDGVGADVAGVDARGTRGRCRRRRAPARRATRGRGPGSRPGTPPAARPSTSRAGRRLATPTDEIRKKVAYPLLHPVLLAYCLLLPFAACLDCSAETSAPPLSFSPVKRREVFRTLPATPRSTSLFNVFGRTESLVRSGRLVNNYSEGLNCRTFPTSSTALVC